MRNCARRSGRRRRRGYRFQNEGLLPSHAAFLRFKLEGVLKLHFQRRGAAAKRELRGGIFFRPPLQASLSPLRLRVNFRLPVPPLRAFWSLYGNVNGDALLAKGPAQASPGQGRVLRGRRPGFSCIKDQALNGRHTLSRPFRALFLFRCKTQGGARSSLALGWLVHGLWP